MIRSFITVIFFSCLLFNLSACVQNDYDTGAVAPASNNKGVLRVGITPNAPPMAFKQQGKLTGIEVEFARGLARFTGKDLKFVELKWEEQIPALVAGKTDIIMSSMTITDARSYQISFCTPYMISGQVSLVRLADMYKFSNGFTDLLNLTIRIGSVKGTTGALFIEKNVATDRRDRYFYYQNPQQGVKSLLDQKIDAFVYDLPMNFYFAARNESNGLAPVSMLLTREQIAWGIRNNEPELQQAADAYLKTIKDNGQLKQMLIKWIPFFKNVFNK